MTTKISTVSASPCGHQLFLDQDFYSSGDLAEFVKQLKKPELVEVVIASGAQVVNEDLLALDDLPNLVSLILDGTCIDNQGLQAVAQIGSLVELDVSYTQGREILDYEGIHYLVGHPSLKRFRAAGQSIGIRELEALSQVINLRDLDIENTGLTDESMPAFENFRVLESLCLFGCAISDAGLSHLVDLPHLTDLDLGNQSETIEVYDSSRSPTETEGTTGRWNEQAVDVRYNPGITNDGLPYIAKLSALRKLSLSTAKIDDDGLSHLSGLSNLESLGLGQTGVGDNGLSALQGLSELTDLELYGTAVTDDGIRALLDAEFTLKTINLASTAVSDEGILLILDSPAYQQKLSHICLCGTSISDKSGSKFNQFKNLNVACLCGCEVGNSTLHAIGDLHKLTGLNLEGTDVSNIGLAYLADLSLEYLYLSGTDVDDGCEEYLAQLDTLETLTVIDTDISPACRHRLWKELPWLRNLEFEYESDEDEDAEVDPSEQWKY